MPAKGQCFTITYKKISNVLQSKVNIQSALTSSNPTEIIALWDTGATLSVITPVVSQKLGLISFRKIPIRTPSGGGISDLYKVNLELPNKVKINNITVASGVPAGCDILIGMDVINKGDFAVSHGNGRTMFSFRMPSMAEIDFCKDSYIQPFIAESEPGRNDRCPCGSGKKYKKCCGNK